jgi:hypothetical protein
VQGQPLPSNIPASFGLRSTFSQQPSPFLANPASQMIPPLLFPGFPELGFGYTLPNAFPPNPTSEITRRLYEIEFVDESRQNVLTVSWEWTPVSASDLTD